MRSSRPFVRSLLDALRGIRFAVGAERNLRIHLVVALAAVALGLAVGLGPGQWGLLALTIALVVAAELFNSALEAAVDLACPRRDPLAGRAKDLAAGGVLVTAVGALAVGVCLFWRPALYVQWLAWAVEHSWSFLLLALALFLGAWFVRGPRKKSKN